jgi:hypothetical protein
VVHQVLVAELDVLEPHRPGEAAPRRARHDRWLL